MARIAPRNGCPGTPERGKSRLPKLQWIRDQSAEIRPLTTSGSGPARRRTVIASGLLLLALALVVIYTRPHDFVSPVALVVVAAIGLAALLLQLRFRHDLPAIHSPLWLNVVGVVCALLALCADYLHLTRRSFHIAAFIALLCFGISGSLILRALRRGTAQK